MQERLAYLLQRPVLPQRQGRIDGIDLARGVAISLMILSHAVSGLYGINQVPDWGMVPVHMLTKFSSSLFILVFGIALAIAFLPKVGTEEWPQRRLHLWVRALVVFFWYKVLTVVEMAPTATPGQIVDTLLYRDFPIWVEILGFYAIALLWVPLLLPLWQKAPLWSRILGTLAVFGLFLLLQRTLDFGERETLEAILIEHPDHYTWGQIARGWMVLAGLLIGEAILRCYWDTRKRRYLILTLGGVGALMLLAFGVLSPDLSEQMLLVARNAGKHPPELLFMLFSIGGALCILALALAGGRLLARILWPVTVVGTDALKAFIFHIVVIFLVLRYLLEFWQVFSYPQVLAIGAALIVGSALWIRLTSWIGRH